MVLKVLDLVGFALEVIVVLMSNHEIKASEPGLDEFKGVIVAIANILFLNEFFVNWLEGNEHKYAAIVLKRDLLEVVCFS